MKLSFMDYAIVDTRLVYTFIISNQITHTHIFSMNKLNLTGSEMRIFEKYDRATDDRFGGGESWFGVGNIKTSALACIISLRFDVKYQNADIKMTCTPEIWIPFEFVIREFRSCFLQMISVNEISVCMHIGFLKFNHEENEISQRHIRHIENWEKSDIVHIIPIIIDS